MCVYVASLYVHALYNIPQGNDNYFLLTKEESQMEDHDYEEPYFEPASEEEDLLQQLKTMSVPFIDEDGELK